MRLCWQEAAVVANPPGTYCPSLSVAATTTPFIYVLFLFSKIPKYDQSTPYIV